jgi:hypothetical protein
MTQWGWMKEELAKWHELAAIGLHLTASAAPGFGLKVMSAGVVAFAFGTLLSRPQHRGSR